MVQTMESKMEKVLEIQIAKIGEEKSQMVVLENPIYISEKSSWEEAEEIFKNFIPKGYELVGYHGPSN
jgi:hypothetical protein